MFIPARIEYPSLVTSICATPARPPDSPTMERDESIGDRWPDRHDIMRWEHLLGLDLVAFEAAIDEKAEPAVPESKVAGLIELERSGKNRKQYCDVLTKRLGVSSVYEVTSAGPGYMNEVAPIIAIKK